MAGGGGLGARKAIRKEENVNIIVVDAGSRQRLRDEDMENECRKQAKSRNRTGPVENDRIREREN